MQKNILKKKYQDSENFRKLADVIQNNQHQKIGLKGLIGSSIGIYLSNLFEKLSASYLVILNDKEEASYFYHDLIGLCGEKNVLLFPSSYKRSVQYDNLERENIMQRTEILNNTLFVKKKSIVVTYPEAIIEKVISKKDLHKNSIKLKPGGNYELETLTNALYDLNFERTDFVYEPGQFSVRGSIVDVFSYSYEHPYRLDFFGQELETIRSFDIENQLSLKNHNHITIIPNLKENIAEQQKGSLFGHLHQEVQVWINDYDFVKNTIADIQKQTTKHNPDKEHELITDVEFAENIQNRMTVEFGNHQYLENSHIIKYNQSYQPQFNKNFDLLSDNLINNQLQGYTNYIVSENEKQIDRLKDIFHDIDPEINFTPIIANFHVGFIDHDLKLCCYTDHQIFDRYHRYKLKEKQNAKATIALNEINNLNPGDYIVHVDHGIGVFNGLETIENNHKKQEAIRLTYKDNDILYVNIHSLHKISKYKGKDGQSPRINKLGTGAWLKLKQNTKKKVKDIAKDLIALYAQRRSQKGFAFSQDSYLNHELEASFIYEDTPDQFTATQSVKKNMESDIPMDHLVCGDVGFGKTEIAIRAAFKAVADSKQVAVLVPTTILAFQHYYTFKDRLENFPATVDYISRLKKSKEQKETIKKLKEGKVDILIGTHRLISKDIQFKDLGLLIIDEEQKFGVAAKEKLKQIKANVDTLTLTATPIPRTLQFSLMGARDLSIINTPPPNRYPIITELHRFNEEVIHDAIVYEVSRNGQVFFINNRIDNIEEVVALVKRLCPKVTVTFAHGQMDGKTLENKMLEFINREYDVLVATTIIESGLDIPNANTIIINNAQNFGLSDLHQLRGRVGRSNKQAFCYLLAPPLNAVSDDARRRLIAIENFSELGSGFNIAMQDLDIRGAGNLLGGEQSGFIADIGFETYHKILNEAMQELRENEFKDLFKEDKTKEKAEDQYFASDCSIDTDFEIFFPNDYIQNISERIKLYRELDNIEEERQLIDFEKQLTDRFGQLPEKSRDLLNIVRLRWKAKSLGIEKIMIRNSTMVCHFVANPDASFYQSQTFMNIIQHTQLLGSKAKFQEQKDKLSISYYRIHTVSEALHILTAIQTHNKMKS